MVQKVLQFIFDTKYLNQTNSNKFFYRLDNGTVIGMIGELNNGIVDTSVAGYVPSLARAEVVDFTQGFFKVTYATIIKRPSRTDFSLRYFWLGIKNCIKIIEPI